jgi:hypothetical protein
MSPYHTTLKHIRLSSMLVVCAVNTGVSPTFAHTTVEHSGAPIGSLCPDLCEALVRWNQVPFVNIALSFGINKFVLPKHCSVFHNFWLLAYNLHPPCALCIVLLVRRVDPQILPTTPRSESGCQNSSWFLLSALAQSIACYCMARSALKGNTRNATRGRRARMTKRR